MLAENVLVGLNALFLAPLGLVSVFGTAMLVKLLSVTFKKEGQARH